MVYSILFKIQISKNGILTKGKNIVVADVVTIYAEHPLALLGNQTTFARHHSRMLHVNALSLKLAPKNIVIMNLKPRGKQKNSSSGFTLFCASTANEITGSGTKIDS